MAEHMGDKFFQVPLATRKTSLGRVEFPILYFDTRCITAFFLCDLDKVHQQLSDVPLRPGLVFGKKAIVGIAFYEYRETSIGPYNEVGVGIPVVRAQDKPPRLPLLDLYSKPETRAIGFYVIDLPVTTASANAAGKEVWGFPKFITDISFAMQDRQFSSTVLDPKTRESMVYLGGKMGYGIPSPALHLKLYSYLQGVELATTVNLRYGATLRSRGTMRLTVGNSTHPMAARLRALGLSGASPVGVIAANRFQSRLNLGVATGCRIPPDTITRSSQQQDTKESVN